MMTMEEARALLLSKTIKDSRHQRAALGVLFGHMERGDEGERLTVICCKCKHPIVDCVRWTNKSGQIVDTWGYMEFEEPGLTCADCLSEGYLGDILVNKKNTMW